MFAWAWLALPAYASATAPQPTLHCALTYAGSTQHVQATPQPDAYSTPLVDVYGRFWFKPVVVGQGQHIEYIALSTYVDTDEGPLLVQQNKYHPPFAVAPTHLRKGQGKSPSSLTGQQFVYAGHLRREFQYHCTLQGYRPSPHAAQSFASSHRARPAANRIPAAGPTQRVSLVFAGDMALDDAAGDFIAKGGDPLAPFADWLDSADIRIANLECVVATEGNAEGKIYTFRAHPRVLPVLRRHLDAVTLANNHSGDFGRAAFAQMLGLLQEAGLQQVGGGRNLREAHTPLIIERHGLRIALLSYVEFMPRSFEADTDAAGVAWSEDEQVRYDIAQARSRYGADVVIPFMHWGWENELVANSRQRQLARTLIDAGADAVVGGHPHVTQDVETYRGKPIVYSVGNFIMKETDNDNQRRAWMLRLELDASGVRAWQTRAVDIGMDGLPHPADRPTPRWTRD
ncbi:CapA family protein [Curvibacter sp. CHRR-16]|nr:CapA family protein [Curvibacter sp. CHRR-16]